jgi:hypothetical protein
METDETVAVSTEASADAEVESGETGAVSTEASVEVGTTSEEETTPEGETGEQTV